LSKIIEISKYISVINYETFKAIFKNIKPSRSVRSSSELSYFYCHFCKI